MPVTWTAVTVTSDPELADAIGSFLIDCGAPGLASEEVGGSTRLTAHFADATAVAKLETYLDTIGSLFPGHPRPRIAVESTTDTDWAENWKQHFPPLTIGSRLYVHPPWDTAIPAGRSAIVLDPGMAFGTGHHASTRGSLVLLERALQERAAARVLDLGTGSGILAIAAVKLGAGRVWAVDIDRDACAVAVENCAANGVAPQVEVSDSLVGVPATVELVLANLFAGQLVGFAPLIAAHLDAGGVAIGAGILAGEADAVQEAWHAAGLHASDRYVEDEWVAIAHRRAP